MIFFITLISLKAIFLGAIYGRLDGGGIAKVSEWVERTLIMYFFVLACVPFAGYWALLAYVGVAGIATGHGQYFLDRVIKALSGERLDFIVRIFFGDDPRTRIDYREWRDDKWKNMPALTASAIENKMNYYGMAKLYWRNVFGMFVTGSFLGLPACILAISFGQPLFALLFSLTGVVKASAYMLGYWIKGAIFPKMHETVFAEYFNGAVRTAICVVVILIFFLDFLQKTGV